MRSNDLCRLSTLSFNVVLVVAYGSTGVVIRDIKVTIRLDERVKAVQGLKERSLTGFIFPTRQVTSPISTSVESRML